MMVWRGPTGSPAWKLGKLPPIHRLRSWNTFLATSCWPNQRRCSAPGGSGGNRLYRAGLWTQLRYKLSRNGEEFENPADHHPTAQANHR